MGEIRAANHVTKPHLLYPTVSYISASYKGVQPYIDVHNKQSTIILDYNFVYIQYANFRAERSSHGTVMWDNDAMGAARETAMSTDANTKCSPLAEIISRSKTDNAGKWLKRSDQQVRHAGYLQKHKCPNSEPKLAG